MGGAQAPAPRDVLLAAVAADARVWRSADARATPCIPASRLQDRAFVRDALVANWHLLLTMGAYAFSGHVGAYVWAPKDSNGNRVTAAT